MDSKIWCYAMRVYDSARGQFLLTLGVGIGHAHEGGGQAGAGYPQTWAVVDDFGTLVCVESWA